MRVTTTAGVSPESHARLEELSAEFVTAERDLLELEPAWNGLVRDADIDHPFLTYEWVYTFWQCFGPGNRLHVVVVRDAGEVIAIAPLMLTSGRVLGIPTRCPEFIGNVHTPRCDLLIGRRHEAARRAIWDVIARDSGWDVLRLCQLPAESPTVPELARLATADGFRPGVWEAQGQRYLRLDTGWEYSIKAKHRSNLRNRLVRLSRLGDVELEVVSSREGLDEALEDGFRIEAAAWKGARGTAMTSDPAIHLFYARLAERMADRGWLRLQFLRLGEQRIAFGYSLCYRNTLRLLKTGYDPEYRLYSPGHLLMWRVLREASQEGITEFDFLGADASWHADWTTNVRPHAWLFVFRKGPRGWLMHAVKFRLLPALRRWRLTRAALDTISAWVR